MILVIGAGQAGLAAGRELRLAGHDVLLLEAHPRLGESWRRRWDSLRLFTPASLSALPGLPMPGADRYPGKDEVADYLRAYAAHFELPVRLGTTVSLLRPAPGAGFEAVTLSLGARQPVLPQRVLGTDVFTWLQALGVVRAPVTSRLGRRVRDRDPLIGLGPRGLRRMGVRVVDRVTAADGPLLRTADGRTVAPRSVIWATGYRPDYRWLRVPAPWPTGCPATVGESARYPAWPTWACPSSAAAARPCWAGWAKTPHWSPGA
ncbi:FAD-dependent oxidoreductase [Streptosporangium sp. NPDC001559]|uniref:FAD-dependent oxidoreductase n=1 Tax=Streptosporangium sp. NPDC001559 TaxID=3366187 RepID=UPI0036E31890